MATQAQIRQRGIASVRAVKKLYRQADSAGERLERELDRLIRRKTLIDPQDIKKAAEQVSQYIELAARLAKAIQDLAIILGGGGK